MLIAEIEDYARLRVSDMKRNLESKRFAALMVEKYGQGMAKAAHFKC